MLYFIPAWYKADEWHELEQCWYARREHSEFDDSVKQVQLFSRNGDIPFSILLLSFAPNFRHFLHRQSVFHAPYWSVFDAMQCVRRTRMMTLSFHNLNWPKGIEFVYTPFLVLAMLHGEKYARVEFGEDGNPIRIDLFDDGRLIRRNYYDDRGFVSATALFDENEKLHHTDYLSEQGVWKLRVFASDGHVEVNPAEPNFLIAKDGLAELHPFMQKKYDSLEAVIEEVLLSFLAKTKDEDLFCAAMQERHRALLERTLSKRRLILSFFENRYEVENHPEAEGMLQRAAYLITDSNETSRKLMAVAGRNLTRIVAITPFDSRVDFGISAQLSVRKILVPVDGLGKERFRELVRALGAYLMTNDLAEVHLFTRRADFGRREGVLAETKEYLKEAGLEASWADSESEMAQSETLSQEEINWDEEESVSSRFFVEQCVDELSVSKCLREQRLVVDMRKKSELYLRISAISMGIPQIVACASPFVADGENGFLVENFEELSEKIAFYLDSLKNWNDALVASYEIGKNYTTGVLMDEWREVIEVAGRD